MSQERKKKIGKGTNWKKKILKFLNESPSGYTITDIAKNVNSTRITVSKYLSLLEQEEKVLSKEIGVYKLYFSKDRKYIELSLVRSFYNAVLSGIKTKLSTKEEFKKLGEFISDSMFTYIVDQYPESLRKQITSFPDFLKVFSKMYPYHDFFYNKDLVIEENIDLEKEKGIYTFNNVELLSIAENLKFHFYIFSGIIERTLSKIFKEVPIHCNIESIDVQKKEVVLTLEKI